VVSAAALDRALAAFAEDGAVAPGALLDAVEAALDAHRRAAPRAERTLAQLRHALLSSKAHLRRVFRDLGAEVPGAITPTEFRHLLRRHHMDLGLTDEALRALMSALFPAAEVVDAPAGSVSWRGFVETLIAAHELPPHEVDDFLSLVGGVGRGLEGGAGTAPEHYPHRPATARSGSSAKGSSAPPSPAPATPTAASAPPSAAPSAARDPAPTASSPPAGADASEDADASEGAGLYARAASFFEGRRWELWRVLRLFDAVGRGTLPATSVAQALASAGFAMMTWERAALAAHLAARFGDARGHVAYSAWLDAAFGSV
jgi:hypothetical protein